MTSIALVQAWLNNHCLVFMMSIVGLGRLKDELLRICCRLVLLFAIVEFTSVSGAPYICQSGFMNSERSKLYILCC